MIQHENVNKTKGTNLRTKSFHGVVDVPTIKEILLFQNLQHKIKDEKRGKVNNTATRSTSEDLSPINLLQYDSKDVQVDQWKVQTLPPPCLLVSTLAPQGVR